jgi:ribosomal protein S3
MGEWAEMNVQSFKKFLSRADIDYALAEAHTTYGRMGIKGVDHER